MSDGPTERTIRNSQYGRTALFRVRNGAVHLKFWTDRTRWLPEWTDSVQQWWEGGPVIYVRFRRWYWLRFGIAVIEPVDSDPHERNSV